MHCHFIMDEFANVSLPDDFDKILSVMRSRGVSVSIILQNLAQLKALFEKQWESIVGNCDEFFVSGRQRAKHPQICVRAFWARKPLIPTPTEKALGEAATIRPTIKYRGVSL